MHKRIAAVIAVSVVSVIAVAAVAVAAPNAPAPKPHGGAKASLYATGLDNPTSFAWGDGAMFAGDSGNSEQVPNGGVYVIKNHTATKIPSDVIFAAGLEFHKKVLYISAADIGAAGPQFQILAWSGWNGVTFTSMKAIYTAPKGFDGFDGLAFGPGGRLYVGVNTGLTDGNDHGPASTSKYVYDILSMNTGGKKLKVFARGIRQPWQLAFAGKSADPFVSDLGPDYNKAGKTINPPDFILHVKKGQNYGFPKCNHMKASKCKGFAKPFKTLKPHWDPMGVAAVGRKLYVGSFTGPKGKGGALYVMPVSGGKLTPVVTGFPLATDALAAHGGYLYVGGSSSSGEIYRVKP